MIPVPAAARPAVDASGSFGSPSYLPSQTFRFVLTVRTTRALENADVSFVILANSAQAKPLFEKYLVNSMAPGASRFSFSGNPRRLGMGDGIYPVVAQVTAGEYSETVRSRLVVIDPSRHGPLLLALVWNVNNTPAISPKGVYLSDATAAMVRGGASPGWLSGHFAEFAKHGKVKASFNLTPQSLEEVLGVAGGYKLREQRRVTPVRPDSRESKDAREFLTRTMQLVRDERIEIVPSPYAYPPIAEIASRGWDSDMRLQMQHGQDVVERSLRTAASPGMFAPGLTLSTGAIPALRRAGVEYTVLTYPGRADRFGSARLSTETAGNLVAFFDDEVSANLLTSPGAPRTAVSDFVGYLARVRLARGKRPTVATVVMQSSNRRRPTTPLLRELYATLASTPWVRTVTLGEAASIVEPSSDLTLPARRVDARMKSYYGAVGRARRSLAVYSSMTLNDNPVRTRLTRNLLISESAVWRQEPGGLKKGLAFADDVTRTVTSELGKISAPARETITLPGQSGKVALNISNRTRHPLIVTLGLSGRLVEFPEGTNVRFELRPGDNYVAVPIRVKTARTAPVTVKVLAGGSTLLESTIYARTTYFNRMAFLVGIILALVGLLVVVYRKAGSARRR